MRSIVRDVFFEPTYGHRAEAVFEQIRLKFKQGRPALLETHRFNFAGSGSDYEASILELRKLLVLIMGGYPEVAFVSTDQLATCYDPDVAGPIKLQRKMGQVALTKIRRCWAVSRLKKVIIVAGGFTALAISLVFARVFLS